MKLIDFHNSGLADIRKKIGADLLNYKIIDWEPREAEVIAIDPTSIKINGIDDTITNKDGDRIVVYIRDWGKFYYDTQGSLPKIHFYNCRTIQGMIINKLFDSKYVGAYTITGLLNVNLIAKDKTTIEDNREFDLGVCSNCLKDAKNDGLVEEKLLNPFSLKKYFDFYEYYRNRVNHPKYNFLNITKNQYPKNWDEISKNEKIKINYICQDCGGNFLNNKKELHTHHKDHNKGNNFTDNFEVLCYNCHAKYHNHM